MFSFSRSLSRACLCPLFCGNTASLSVPSRRFTPSLGDGNSKSTSRRSCTRLLEDHPDDVQRLASLANNARTGNYQLSRPLTHFDPSLDQSKAYQVAAAVCALRKEGGEIPVGRKIGFTNRNIWPEYNIDASNWSYVYDRTVSDLASLPQDQGSASVVDISELSQLEPRLEPEIMFGLKKVPYSAMTDHELLDCIEWISHGFEIVQSIFPGWKFTAAETTAAFALHGRLLIGNRIQTTELGPPDRVLHNLSTFRIEIFRNSELVDHGTGANVLGSPINSLRHLCDLLEKDEWNALLSEGEA